MRDNYIDRTLSHEEIVRRNEKARRAREFALDARRQAEDRTITETPGAGCGHCIDGKRSVPSMKCEIDMCGQMGTFGCYLPVNIYLDNQRPVWCPGFNAVEITHETTEQQEELPI